MVASGGGQSDSTAVTFRHAERQNVTQTMMVNMPGVTTSAGGISANSRALLEGLHRGGPGPYTAEDAASMWGIDPSLASRRLAMLAAQGWLARPARGLYVPVPLDAVRSGEWAEDPWLVAAKLLAEYVSAKITNKIAA